METIELFHNKCILDKINNDLKLLDEFMSWIDCYKGRKVRFTNDKKESVTGFYKNCEIICNRVENSSVDLVCRLFRVKNDGTPSKVSDLICNPTKIEILDN